MIKETIAFYDRESAQYSEKRYSGITQSYYQFLFKKRLALFLNFVRKSVATLPTQATLLEIGCADGVVVRAIETHFPKRFEKYLGIDVSPKMIEQATQYNTNPKATFTLRDRLSPVEQFDVVIELGVHPIDLEGELTFVSDHLKPGGYFFYALAGKRSSHVRFKLRHVAYAKDYRTYREYESALSRVFSIVDTRVYGLFIPKLWMIPLLGRLLQPIVDQFCALLIPEFFHEKIYVLRKKD